MSNLFDSNSLFDDFSPLLSEEAQAERFNNFIFPPSGQGPMSLLFNNFIFSPSDNYILNRNFYQFPLTNNANISSEREEEFYDIIAATLNNLYPEQESESLPPTEDQIVDVLTKFSIVPFTNLPENIKTSSCSICIGPYAEKDIIYRTTACCDKQYICGDCLVKTFNVKLSCPFCNNKFECV